MYRCLSTGVDMVKGNLEGVYTWLKMSHDVCRRQLLLAAAADVKEATKGCEKGTKVAVL